MRRRSPQTFRRLVRHELLVTERSALTRQTFRRLELEVVRHCNYRCVFCPVAKAPKPKGFMTEEVFALVLTRAVEYGIRGISLNHYSEPTLDPHLVQKIRQANERGLHVQLNTNASCLDERKIQEIAKLGNTYWTVNLPSADAHRYEALTGSKLFAKVKQNLALMHKHKIPVILSINAQLHGADDEVDRINEVYEPMFGTSFAWDTNSRAGLMDNHEFAVPIQHTGKLMGCAFAQWQMNVSFDGKAFLCCQDFQQEVLLGDLRKQSIREIEGSERVVEIKKWVFGLETPPANFICTRCQETQAITSAKNALGMGAGVHMTSIDPQVLVVRPVNWV